MIIVAGTIRIEAEHREPAIVAMANVMAETRKEDGCISYTFSADFQDESLFHLFEEWESQEHLDAHLKAPHIDDFRAASAELGERVAEIHTYVATDKTAL